MKVVALVPVRNEARLLPTYLSSVLPIVDAVIAVDDGSDDGSRDVLAEAGAHVIDLPHTDGVARPISLHRQLLLDAARANGGTHLVWLDADEAFTAPFLRIAPDLLRDLRPGHKLMLQWVALWKSTNQLRDDASVWSHAFKDFVVRDDGTSQFTVGQWHEGRTNGPNDPQLLHTIPPESGAVLHFQFVDWEQFQVKQAWHRCRERIAGSRSVAAINRTYALTLDDPTARCSEVPAAWYEGLVVPPPPSLGASPSWYESEILQWFDEHGVEKFEELEIWHVPRFLREFEERTGRKPRPQSRIVARGSLQIERGRSKMSRLFRS